MSIAFSIDTFNRLYGTNGAIGHLYRIVDRDSPFRRLIHLDTFAVVVTDGNGNPRMEPDDPERIAAQQVTRRFFFRNNVAGMLGGSSPATPTNLQDSTYFFILDNTLWVIRRKLRTNNLISGYAVISASDTQIRQIGFPSDLIRNIRMMDTTSSGRVMVNLSRDFLQLLCDLLENIDECIEDLKELEFVTEVKRRPLTFAERTVLFSQGDPRFSDGTIPYGGLDC